MSAAESPRGTPVSSSSYTAPTEMDRQVNRDDFELVRLLHHLRDNKGDIQTIEFLISSSLEDNPLEGKIYIIRNPFDKKLGVSTIDDPRRENLSQILKEANFVLIPRRSLEGQLKDQLKKESSLGKIFKGMFKKQEETTTPKLTTNYLLLVVPNWLREPFTNAQTGQLVDPKTNTKITVTDNRTFGPLIPCTIKGTSNTVYIANTVLPQAHRQSAFIPIVVQLKNMMHNYCQEVREELSRPYLKRLTEELILRGFPRVIAELIAYLTLPEAYQGDLNRPPALPPIEEEEKQVGGRGKGVEGYFDEKAQGKKDEINPYEEILARMLNITMEELQRLKALESLDRDEPPESPTSSSSSTSTSKPSSSSSAQSTQEPKKSPEPEKGEIIFGDIDEITGERVAAHIKPKKQPENK